MNWEATEISEHLIKLPVKQNKTQIRIVDFF